MNKSEFEKLIAAIADGEDADLSALATGSEAKGLLRLQSLAKAFKQAPSSNAQDNRPTLFSWRHLAVKELLGSGAFGQVYRAYDPILRRDVALKLSHAEPDQNAIGQVVATEARRMARLRHPNILAVHGADEDHGRVGIWSDLLEGTTLEAVLKEHAPLAPADVLKLAIPLADALQLIHRRSLTHGDFKAANIMRQPDGSPVVMDFGASRDMTGSAATIGSPLIMAPELFEEGVSTAATDVYAFGALLFQMLSGQYPIHAETLDELRQKHLDRAPVRFNLVPRNWRRLIASMLSPNAQLRPDAESIRAQLETMRTARQRLFRRVAVAAVIGSLSAGLVVSTLAYREAARERDRAESTTNTMIDILQSPRPSRSGRELRVLDLLRDLKPRLDKMLLDQPESRARLLIELAKTFLYFDEFESAQQLADQALEACSSCTATDLATLVIDHHHILGEFDLRKLRVSQAEQHGRAALEAAEQHLSPDSVERVYAMAWLGKVLNTQRRVGEARPLLEEAVRRGAAISWSNKAQWAFVRVHWLNNVIAREDYPVAEPMAREMAQWAEVTLGLRHSSTLWTHQNLNRILVRTGKLDEAEALLRADVDLASDWLGDADATTLAAREQLAWLTGERGRIEESITQFERIRNDILAGAEPDQELLLVVSGNLASRYKENQQYDKAETLYAFVIEQSTKALGSEHGRVLLNRGNLADLYLARGQFDDALRIAGDVERLAAVSLGDGSAVANFARVVQGRSLVARKDWTTGLLKLEHAASRSLANLGPTASVTMDAQLYLAKALADSGDRDRALALLGGLLPHAEKALGKDHERTREIEALRNELARPVENE